MMNRYERWRSFEYAANWYEAALKKQAKIKQKNTMDAIASRARKFGLQGQVGRAAKIFSLEGIAPDNRKTLIELKKLHTGENGSNGRLQLRKVFILMKQMSFYSFSLSNFTAAGPLKLYTEHLLHASNCSISNQSKREMSSVTKLVKLTSIGQIPSFVSPACCSATFTALKMRKPAFASLAAVKFFGAKLLSAMQPKQLSRLFSFFEQSS